MEGTFKASSRYLKISPRKLRLVAALVRGKPLDEALVLLRYVPNKGGRFMETTLRSVLGNAKDRSKGNVEGLVVKQVRVDEGPQPRDTKRWTPKAMGRVGKMRRRTSHLQVLVARDSSLAPAPAAADKAESKPAKKPVKGAAKKKAPAAKSAKSATKAVKAAKPDKQEKGKS
jgi:large subunit ribosomal protein L22